MKKVVILSLLGVLLLGLGGLLAVVGIYHWRLYPLPYSMLGESADGSSLKFAQFTPDNRPLIGHKEVALVIEFWDWKNNKPIKRVIHSGSPGFVHTVLYSDEKSVVALIDNHVLYIYDKPSETILKREFNVDYHVLTVTPDTKHVLVYSFAETAPKLLLLNWDGSIYKEQPILAETEPGTWLFFEAGTKLAFITLVNSNMQSQLFVWDLVNNSMVEKKDAAITAALPWSNLGLDASGKLELRFENNNVSRKIPIRF